MRELDLAARRFRRAAVVDDVVRGLQARRAIDLRADHLQRFRFWNRVAPHQALELRRLRRVDDEYPIDELAEVRLDEQWNGDERIRSRESRRAWRACGRGSAGAGSLRDCAVWPRLRRPASAAPAGSARPSACSTPGPNSAVTAARPGSPRATTSRATTSVSMSEAPSFTNIAPTSDLPLAMPPVRPTTSRGGPTVASSAM